MFPVPALVSLTVVLAIGSQTTDAFVTRYRHGYSNPSYRYPYGRSLHGHTVGSSYYGGPYTSYSRSLGVVSDPVVVESIAHAVQHAAAPVTAHVQHPAVSSPVIHAAAPPVATHHVVEQPVVAAPLLKAVPAVPELYHAIQDELDEAVVVAAVPEQPVAVPAPAVHVAQVAPVQVNHEADSFQFHAQDEHGNTEYGYSNQNSAKHETSSADGTVRGTYSYLDDAGHHTINYVADDWGFRLV